MGNAEEQETQENRYRKALSTLEISFGVLAALAVIRGVSVRGHVRFGLYAYTVGFPFLLLLLVCGAGLRSSKRPIWPIWLNWVIGFVAIAMGIGLFISHIVANSEQFTINYRLIYPLVGLVFALALGVSIFVLNYKINRLASARTDYQEPSFDEDSGSTTTMLSSQRDDVGD